MFDEYFNLPTIVVSSVPVAAAPRLVDLADSPMSTSIDQYASSTSANDLTLFTWKAVNDLLLDTGMSLTTYSDADHAGCLDTRRSTSGRAQFLGDKLVIWSSKKQKSIKISSKKKNSGTLLCSDEISTGCHLHQTLAKRKIQNLDRKAWYEKHVSGNTKASDRGREREPTYQVVMDSLALTTCYYAFLITAEVPVNHMHQFWATVNKHKASYLQGRQQKLTGTMRFISKHEDTQVYGALLPKALTNQALLDSVAYKTSYAIARGVEPPMPKKIQKNLIQPSHLRKLLLRRSLTKLRKM
nr:retrovirus-related Pol polyprotein from transposon TNT 1-94 [Tanacetum cinerariifolium]